MDTCCWRYVVLALIASIAIEFSIPEGFLQAIALTENAQLDATAINKNKNGTKDLGLMQLNSCWYTDKNWDDAETNIRAACNHINMIIKEGKCDTWWHVAVLYNAGHNITIPPDSSVCYANAVTVKWEELGGRKLFIEETR